MNEVTTKALFDLLNALNSKVDSLDSKFDAAAQSAAVAENRLSVVEAECAKCKTERRAWWKYAITTLGGAIAAIAVATLVK